MFSNIRRYRIGPGQRDEVVRRVDEGWADQLRNEHGFVSYHLLATGPDELVSVTTCLDEQDLARVVQKSGEWVGIHLLGLEVTLEDQRQGMVVSHLGS
jgi:heme-degrading monooxygenase HmoA